jgi:geranylgeranyl pyrophosphate synthase
MMKCNNGELMDLVSDSIENAKRSAREEFEIAERKLDNFDNSFAKTKLKELGEYIITRSK